MPIAALVIELPVFGIFALWLVAVIPAALVTALKERWLWFAAGFMTLGVVWIVGAIAMAAPQSWWAQAFYGEDRMARAADPDHHGRPGRIVALWIGGAAAAVLLLGFVTARPSAVFGVSGAALQNSVDSLAGEPSCSRKVERTWICAAYDDQVSGSVSYLVRVKRLGCWTATRVGNPGEGSSRQMSGCVTALDYVF